MKIVLATGGFDPIHAGHIHYLREAKKLGDILIAGINSDEWLIRKKGRAFMSLYERQLIVSAIDCVDAAYRFDDTDGSACALIKDMQLQYPNDEIIFANGGDRNVHNIPEFQVPNVEFAFGVGGNNKMNSSSWLLDEWKSPKTLRNWGQFRVIYDVPSTKVKELVIEPKHSLSLQRHAKRSEYWFVSEGRCDVKGTLSNGYSLPTQLLTKHSTHHVPVGEWHQLCNPYDEPCKIVEIQYGEECVEDDIERKNA